MWTKKYNPNLQMTSESTNKNKGFTLLEIIVAIFVLLVGVLGAYSVTQQIISYTHSAANRLTAAYLAKEGIEIVRNIRDTNWLEGSSNPWDEDLTGCGGECGADYLTPTNLDPDLNYYDPDEFLKITNGFYKYSDTGTTTNFKRKITITGGGIEPLEVTVKVTWQEKDETKGPIKVMENLYNWY